MRMKNFIYQVKPPCSKCPYKLGHIQTPANPCPQCRMDNYRNYSLFKEQLSKEKSL